MPLPIAPTRSLVCITIFTLPYTLIRWLAVPKGLITATVASKKGFALDVEKNLTSPVERSLGAYSSTFCETHVDVSVLGRFPVGS